MRKLSAFILAVCLTGPIACGGPRSNGVYSVADDDGAMEEAMSTARSTIGTFVERINRPPATQSAASLKVRFEEHGNVEHIWLADVGHKDGVFTGSVANDPVHITSVKAGDRVSIPLARVTDWMAIDNNELIGGYTVRLLRDRASGEERKAIDASLGGIVVK